jgi:ferrous iron transport protein B
MELPTYKLPGVRMTVHRMWESGWSFIQRAGTLILAVSILVWAAAYYPRKDADTSPSPAARPADSAPGAGELAGALASDTDEPTAREHQLQGHHLRHSYLGRLGRFIEPVVRPLGWDWRIGCAVIASFPAREVVVATLGVIYNLGQDEDEASPALRDVLRTATWDGTTRRVFNIPVALSLLVFFSLCAQCLSTLVVMRRETNSWRWPAFTFAYMTTLAYVGAWIAFQGSTWFLAS